MSEQTEQKKIDSTKQFEKPAAPKNLPVIIVGIVLFIAIFFGMFWQILPRLNPEKTIVEKQAPEKNIAKENSISPSYVEPAEEPAQENNRINELEEEIAILKENHQKTIDELKEKHSAENSENLNKAATAVSTMVVFADLKDAIKNGKPYEEQLTQFKKLTEKKARFSDVIASLEVNAKSGVTPPTQIKSRFSALIKDVIISRDSGVFKKFMSQFIIIRKVGEATGDDDEAVMARAEKYLTNDDIRSAITELEKLSSPAQETFKNWVNDSEAWLESLEKIDALKMLLTQTESTTQI